MRRLVLMDMQMPEMDGMEATRAIRALEGLPAQPRIVAMTANALEGDRERCIDAGMDDYITKPVDPGELAAALVKWGNPAEDAPSRDPPMPGGAPLPCRTYEAFRFVAAPVDTAVTALPGD